MSQKLESRDSSSQRGKLRIGNDWNAITIIALSQSNPLKAIAELVENSIDARATSVTIVRGRSEGRHHLEVRDNGQGIPRDADGRPDFRYDLWNPGLNCESPGCLTEFGRSLEKRSSGTWRLSCATVSVTVACVLRCSTRSLGSSTQ